MKLGIIGNGFVGNAIAHAFIPCMDVKIYDKNPEKSFNTLEEVVNDSDVVFVSVPTPMRPDGTIDLSIVESVFDSIQVCYKSENKTVFVLKRSMASGFAGIQNPLFFKSNSRMLFGDAKDSVSNLVSEFKD